MGIKHLFLWIFSIALLLASASPLFAIRLEEPKSSAPIYVLGDTHGDLEAVLQILFQLKLIDAEGNWKGKQAKLVFAGDVVGKGDSSKGVLDYILELRSQAEAVGGQVHSILGNHEVYLLEGVYDYLPKKDRRAFLSSLEEAGSLDEVFALDGPYGWLRSWPGVLEIEGNLIVHAGITKPMLSLSVEEINAWVNAELSHLLEIPIRRFTLGRLAPMQNDFFARFGAVDSVPEHGYLPSVEELESFLESIGVERIVVGHIPTKRHGYRILTQHPIYQEKVLRVDTGISNSDGRLSVLRIQGEKLKAKYFKRKKLPKSLKHFLKTKCSTALKNSVKL